MTNDPNTQPPQGEPPGDPLSYQGAAPGVPAPANKDEKTMAMLAHLLGIIGFVGPLIIWLIKKDTSAFVDDQGKEALNFHLTMLVGYLIGAVTFWLCMGIFIVIAVWIVSLIFSIVGAMKANQGIAYRYPFAIRLIK